MTRLLFVLALSAGISTASQAQAATDVFIAPLSRVRDSIVVGKAINVTNRAGYDNQPSFTPDSRSILYTATSDGQADIWRYDIAAKRTTRMTSTPESEYSATVMPGGLRMSVIRVERDSTQRLWSFGLDGSNPQLLLAGLKPVGYHAWLTPTTLATYVLGTPSTLHVIESDGGRDEVRARGIGRALQRIPGQQTFSYTQADSSRALWITTRPITGESESPIVRAAPDNEFHTWMPDGTLLSATRDVLVRWNRALDATSAWLPVANLATSGLKNVSRLAVSPDGKWLAFAAEPLTP